MSLQRETQRLSLIRRLNNISMSQYFYSMTYFFESFSVVDNTVSVPIFQPLSQPLQHAVIDESGEEFVEAIAEEGSSSFF